jgi:GAF domain-containing protein
MSHELVQSTVKEVIQMQKDGMPQHKVLARLVRAAEAVAGDNSVSSILILDKDGLLRNGASPGLPYDYLTAIDGLRPDPKVGTCTAAAATGDMILTPDFRADSKWAELRHLPLALGFVGAWSMPIKTQEGKVVGTFGTYFREHRQPSQEEINAIQSLAQAAANILTLS